MGSKHSKHFTTERVTNFFNHLNTDVLIYIFSFLTPNELCIAQLINKKINRLLNSNEEFLWRDISNRIQKSLQIIRPKNMGWKQFACKHYSKLVSFEIHNLIRNQHFDIHHTLIRNQRAEICYKNKIPKCPLIDPNTYKTPFKSIKLKNSIKCNQAYLVDGNANHLFCLMPYSPPIHIYDTSQLRKKRLPCVGTFERLRITYTFCVSKNSQFLISGGMDSWIYIYKLNLEQKTKITSPTKEIIPSGAIGGIYCLRFVKDDRQFISASGDTYIRVWDLESYKCVSTYFDHPTYILSIDYNPVDPNLFVSGGETIKLWDLRTKKPCAEFIGAKDEISSIQFSPDGQVIGSGGDDGYFRSFDIRSSVKELSLINVQKSVSCIRFSSFGSHIFVSTKESMQLYNIVSGKCEVNVGIKSMCIHVGGNRYVASCNNDGILTLFGNY